MLGDDPANMPPMDDALDKTFTSLGSPIRASPGSSQLLEPIENFSSKLLAEDLSPDIYKGMFKR